MNRQAVMFATLASAFGLGFLLFRRQQVTPFAGETTTALPAGEAGRLAEKVEDIMASIGKTSEVLERAMERAEENAGGAAAAFLAQARKAVIGAAVTAVGLGLLSALIVFIYSPERHQQEKLWHTAKAVLAPVGGALAIVLGRTRGA